MICLDAGVLLAAEDLDDANHPAASALLRTGALGTVELAAYEAANVAEVRSRDPEAGRRLRERVWAIAALGALVRVDRALAERAAELAAPAHHQRPRRGVRGRGRAARRAAGEL